MADMETEISEKSDLELSKLAETLLNLEEKFPCSSNQMIRPGSQLSEKSDFHDKQGNIVSAYPVIVDFRRLLQLHNNNNVNQDDNNVINGISNVDLLHAVVGLYDIALSEMTLDVLYATVCEKWARTIVLVQDLKDAIKCTHKRKQHRPLKKQVKEDDESTTKEENENITGKDVYEEEECAPSKFKDVFSDTDDEEDEEEGDNESDEEEDFSTGIKSFVRSAKTRRKSRIDGDVTEKNIGVENRIIGCLTFEKKYVRHKDRIVHLTILTVRPRFRKYGIGRYLLSQVLDPNVSGQFEAVVVHADSEAVDFFKKFSFSDDVVLNSRWSELAEQFTNCTLMCYLPGFTGHTVLSTIELPGLSMYEMDEELKKWKEKSLEAYQGQVTCVFRMKHEIVHLQKKVKTQDNMIKMLAIENEKLKQEKTLLKKEVLEYRLSSSDNISSIMKTDVGLEDTDFDSVPKFHEPYDHMVDAAFFYNISQQFKESMHSDPNIKIQYDVISVNKATVCNALKDEYRNNCLLLHDQNMVTQLYYCGGLEKSHRLHEIIHTGFKEEDFTCGEFGHGIYLSKYSSRAARFSSLGKLLLVEVGLGVVQTVTKPDRTRKKPCEGSDSIIVPGRLSSTENTDAMYNQEYIIFNCKQLLPLCLINYIIAA